MAPPKKNMPGAVAAARWLAPLLSGLAPAREMNAENTQSGHVWKNGDVWRQPRASKSKKSGRLWVWVRSKKITGARRFRLLVHLPGFHRGYLFLTHSHLSIGKAGFGVPLNVPREAEKGTENARTAPAMRSRHGPGVAQLALGDEGARRFRGLHGCECLIRIVWLTLKIRWGFMSTNHL